MLQCLRYDRPAAEQNTRLLYYIGPRYYIDLHDTLSEGAPQCDIARYNIVQCDIAQYSGSRVALSAAQCILFFAAPAGDALRAADHNAAVQGGSVRAASLQDVASAGESIAVCDSVPRQILAVPMDAAFLFLHRCAVDQCQPTCAHHRDSAMAVLAVGYKNVVDLRNRLMILRLTPQTCRVV